MTYRDLPEYGEKPTPRELQIVKRLALGLTNIEIGLHLGVSEFTIKTFLARITAKLDARGRNAIVAAAYEEQWLRLPDELVLKQADEIRERRRSEQRQALGRAA